MAALAVALRRAAVLVAVLNMNIVGVSFGERS
jgi:hypothetical protein